MKLVVIGSSNMDLVITVPNIPSIGETVLGGRSSMVFGGKGANQAIAAKRSGGDITFIAKVGDDLFGKNMKEHFGKEGLDTELILTDPTEPTGVAQIFVSSSGENAIAVASGANMCLHPNDISAHEALLTKAEMILVQLETPIETIKYIAELISDRTAKLLLNPAPAQNLSPQLLRQTWLITPNESEASLLTGITVTDEASAKAAATILIEQGVQQVIITLGANGCLYTDGKEYTTFPAFAVDPVDTTGAGDVFNGTLAVQLTQGKSIAKAIGFASAAAALSVTKAGAQPSIPTLSEINDFLLASNSNI
ncbi:MAG: ribokinase [Saprospiraceae bacterium]|jgi:ribokinase